MPELRVIEGGKSPANPTIQFICEEESEFGPPPSLAIALIGATIGAIGGLLSLLIFFLFWSHEEPPGGEWLIFAIIGAAIGSYIRIERPFRRYFG